MAFNRLYKHIETLIRTDEPVGDNIPCKSDILGVRECRKGGKVSFYRIKEKNSCLEGAFLWRWLTSSSLFFFLFMTGL